MGFDAGQAAVALEWDLRPYVQAHGTAPEPSRKALDDYATQTGGIFDDMGLELKATADEEDIEKEVRRVFSDQLEGKSLQEAKPTVDAIHEKIRRVRVEATSGICCGSPTAEEIEALPPRIQEAFLGWVAGWAVDPTMELATSSSPALSRNGALVT